MHTGLLNLGLNNPLTPNLGAQVQSSFANGEQGAWFDPSDQGTLFQDFAGTTPVTAVEQPVGLMLDKSRGLALGPELVTNGEFSSNLSGWYIGSSISAAVVGGEAQVTLAGALGSSANNWFASGDIVLDGDWSFFYIEFDATWVSGAGSLQAGTTYYPALTIPPNAGKTRYRISASSIRGGFGAVGVGASVAFGSTAAAVWRIDNVSCKRLPGNHAFQPTAPARPTLSARVNLLDRTELLNTSPWLKVNAGVASIPLVTENYLGQTGVSRVQFNLNGGTLAGDFSVINQPATVAIGVSYTSRFQIRATSAGEVGKVVLHRHAAGGAYQQITLTADWQDAGRAEIAGTATINFDLGLRGAFGAANSADVLVRVVSLLPTNESHLPYQRVNTATDYDTAGFPMYLRFDGVDDWMQTGSINFTGTDKMLVAAGVRKLSDAAIGVIAEQGATVDTFLMGPGTAGGANYRATIRRGTTVDGYADGNFPSPITNIVSAALDRAQAVASNAMRIRVNGVQQSPAGVLGGPLTGNFTNNILYIGSRSGTGLFFNGRLYGLIVRGAQSSFAQVISAEQFLALESGITL